ncbi:hypothetical protein [Pseudoxanthomonas gei]|uniref:hypothetical protein n=1 Tax=Pseudoxanthomonas gei TaxID=1383030 RepID=UPI001390787C|nr:hypothetical protein [Pseudoxanthomonas gei]
MHLRHRKNGPGTSKRQSRHGAAAVAASLRGSLPRRRRLFKRVDAASVALRAQMEAPL